MVQEAIEDGRGDDVVGEDGPPVSVALVRGQDDRTLLVSCRDQLKQAGGCEGVERQVAHLVEDEELGLDQQGHPLPELVLVAGTLELGHQILHGDEVNGRTGNDGFVAERNAEVRLTDARRSEQEHVLLAFQERERGEFAQLAFIHRGLEGEGELIQALVVGEVCPLGLEPHVPAMLGLALSLERLFEEVEIRQVLGGGLLGDGFEAVGQVRQAEHEHMVEQAFRLNRHGRPPHRTRCRSTAAGTRPQVRRSGARPQDRASARPPAK